MPEVYGLPSLLIEMQKKDILKKFMSEAPASLMTFVCRGMHILLKFDMMAFCSVGYDGVLNLLSVSWISRLLRKQQKEIVNDLPFDSKVSQEEIEDGGLVETHVSDLLHQSKEGNNAIEEHDHQ
ncbi:hypothetical protein Leryth_023881 [Lithospermum erythrorhizon]|nr:hypothetical protein Leryth_023881 [Lithospermum erythrorhizon]